MVEEIQGSMRWENKMRQNQSSMKVSKTLKEVLQQKNKENTIGSIKSKVRIGHWRIFGKTNCNTHKIKTVLKETEMNTKG